MRPIDADALFQEMIKTIANMMRTRRWMRKDETNEEEILSVIQNAPTLDCAPVIRCKDCMWWKTNGCWFHQPGKCVEREPNDFCSDGQRRSEDV